MNAFYYTVRITFSVNRYDGEDIIDTYVVATNTKAAWNIVFLKVRNFGLADLILKMEIIGYSTYEPWCCVPINKLKDTVERLCED